MSFFFFRVAALTGIQKEIVYSSELLHVSTSSITFPMLTTEEEGGNFIKATMRTVTDKRWRYNQMHFAYVPGQLY